MCEQNKRILDFPVVLFPWNDLDVITISFVTLNTDTHIIATEMISFFDTIATDVNVTTVFNRCHNFLDFQSANPDMFYIVHLSGSRKL